MISGTAPIWSGERTGLFESRDTMLTEAGWGMEA